MNFKFLVFVFQSFYCGSTSWSISNSLFSSRIIVQNKKILDPIIRESISTGAQMAVDECRSVFKWDRWNCPQIAFSKQMSHVSTKEQAYVDAILAAGIIYSITRDCSQGIIKGCGCSQNMESIQTSLKSEVVKDWAWGGCSDDASFGENLILKMLESSEKYSDPQAYVSRHNKRIGREIIREKMLKTCKCHGVSGSCSFQTCWMQMPTFPQIARQLRERYNKAIMISFEKTKGAIVLGNSARHLPLLSEDILPPTMVYFEKSPNFCLSNNATGTSGTKGRTCSRNHALTTTIAERKSCRNLCRSCGYKIRKQQKRVTVKCNCKFIWCCEVECDVCVQNVNEFFCH